jgi:hypothetical protein
MVRLFLLTIAAIMMASNIGSAGNECFDAKPVLIAGAFCGRVYDTSGTAAGEIELRTLSEAGNVVAEITADAKGSFRFPRIPVGKYRVDAPGWYIAAGDLEVTKAGAACTRPVTLNVSPVSCLGGISDKRPPRK